VLSIPPLIAINTLPFLLISKFFDAKIQFLKFRPGSSALKNGISVDYLPQYV
jgi:hypothetical protein